MCKETTQDDKGLDSFRACFGLAILAVLVIIPPFLGGYLSTYDVIIHMSWNDLFQKQFFSGDFYPRWLFEMNGGRGSPVFFFYSPLPYYFSTFFSLFSFGSHASWYALGMTYCFALWISSIGLWKFLQFYIRQKTAYLFAVFYMLFPYYVVINLHIRFAFTEFFAISWIPFLFYYTKKMADGDKSATLKLSIIYLLLILSHIPSTLLISPVVMIYYLIERTPRNNLLAIFPPLFLGAGMASFYLIPIIFLKKYASISKMFEGRFYFEKAFLSLEDWTGYNSLLNLFVLIAILLIILCLFSDQKKSKTIIFFAFVSLFSIFMMFPPSTFLWKIFPIFQIIQFPSRFFIILNFSLVCLSALSLVGAKGKLVTKKMIYSIYIAFSIITLCSCYLKVFNPPTIETNKFIEEKLLIRAGTFEYLPSNISKDIEIKVRNRTLGEIKNLFATSSDEPQMSYVYKNNKYFLLLKSDIPLSLYFNQFYFPSWQCLDANTGQEIQLQQTENSMISAFLEGGTHQLIFKQKMTPPEKYGLLLSLFSLAGLVIITFRQRYQR